MDFRKRMKRIWVWWWHHAFCYYYYYLFEVDNLSALTKTSATKVSDHFFPPFVLLFTYWYFKFWSYVRLRKWIHSSMLITDYSLWIVIWMCVVDACDICLALRLFILHLYVNSHLPLLEPFNYFIPTMTALCLTQTVLLLIGIRAVPFILRTLSSLLLIQLLLYQVPWVQKIRYVY